MGTGGGGPSGCRAAKRGIAGVPVSVRPPGHAVSCSPEQDPLPSPGLRPSPRAVNPMTKFPEFPRQTGIPSFYDASEFPDVCSAYCLSVSGPQRWARAPNRKSLPWWPEREEPRGPTPTTPPSCTQPLPGHLRWASLLDSSFPPPEVIRGGCGPSPGQLGRLGHTQRHGARGTGRKPRLLYEQLFLPPSCWALGGFIPKRAPGGSLLWLPRRPRPLGAVSVCGQAWPHTPGPTSAWPGSSPGVCGERGAHRPPPRLSAQSPLPVAAEPAPGPRSPGVTSEDHVKGGGRWDHLRGSWRTFEEKTASALGCLRGPCVGVGDGRLRRWGALLPGGAHAEAGGSEWRRLPSGCDPTTASSRGF